MSSGSNSYLKIPPSPSPSQPNPPSKDPKDWNAHIKRQAKLENDNAILSAYANMLGLRVLPDNATLPLVLKACPRLNDVELGKRVHSSILGTDLMEDVPVATSLVDFYCQCGVVEDARYVFGRMAERNVVLWNAMINGYVDVGDHDEAISVSVEIGEAECQTEFSYCCGITFGLQGSDGAEIGAGNTLLFSKEWAIL